MNKKKRITLIDCTTLAGEKQFKVIKLQNTLHYNIGEILTKSQVFNMITNDKIEVTIEDKNPKNKR